MMQVIPCKQCGSKAGTPVRQTSVSVEFTAADGCKECYQSVTRRRAYHFCSAPCFVTFVVAHPELAQLDAWRVSL